jgi:hypothetical protein
MKRNLKNLKKLPILDPILISNFFETEGIKKVHSFTLWQKLISQLQDPILGCSSETPLSSIIAETDALPARLVSRLEENNFVGLTSTLQSVRTSADGSTTKLLVELQDKFLVESVIIRHTNEKQNANRVTLCVSSQVGCAMACTFCATGTMGEVGSSKFQYCD